MADFITLSSTSKDTLNGMIAQYQAKGYSKVGDIYEQTIEGVATYFQQMRKG